MKAISLGSIVKVGITTILIVCSAYFSIHAFQASSLVRENGEAIEKEESEFNLFLNRGHRESKRSAEEVVEVMKPLDFMVWQKERKQASIDASAAIHSQINTHPFNASLWRQLSYAQVDSGVPLSERVWSLQVALKLSRWNYLERSYLAHHCLAEYPELKSSAPALCEELIHQLPALPVSHLVRDTGVNKKQLEMVLIREGLLVPGDTHLRRAE